MGVIRSRVVYEQYSLHIWNTNPLVSPTLMLFYCYCQCSVPITVNGMLPHFSSHSQEQANKLKTAIGEDPGYKGCSLLIPIFEEVNKLMG